MRTRCSSPIPPPDAELPVHFRRADWRLDVSDALPGDARGELAASWVAPAAPTTPSGTLLVCLPGGFLSRRYFDLATPAERARDTSDRTYSFACAMARRGHTVLAIDHLGVGDSTLADALDEGITVGVEDAVRTNQRALELAVGRRSREGLSGGGSATDFDRVIGVGHSMGSLMAVEQQALCSPFDGLVLFSFSTHGTPAFLDDRLRAYAGDPERLRAEMPAVIRESMGVGWPERATGEASDRRAAFGVGTAPPEAEEALQGTATRLFAAGGITAMVPGGCAPAAERIESPVLMVWGDHDLHDDRHTRAELPRVSDLTTWCLPDAWHCHFVSNERERLWQAVSAWLEGRTQPTGDPR